MPPQVKITKTAIVETALLLVREGGEEALNARDLASALNCSTQPIFSNFSTMEELRDEIINAAYSLYLEFIKKETESQKYPPYKSSGMAYIRFAKDEKELFKLLFMRNRTKEELSPSLDFENAVEMVMKANGVTREKATLMHLEVWACVHGIGVMIATSFLNFEWDMISNMISDVYLGIRARHLSEEK